MIPGGRDSKIFTGVMDKDTEGRYLGAGNYRNLLNARSSINSEGSFGAIEDVMGNVLVNNPYLTNGRNKVIGSYEDIAGQSCIFFVWNEFGYHGIYRWFANRVGFPDGVIEKIYQVADPSSYDQFNPNPLNFQENSLIVGVNLVDNLLYWTDGFNDPKVINIDKANNTNKLKEYNLYLNTVTLNQSLQYTITVQLNGAVLETIVANITFIGLENRINQFYIILTQFTIPTTFTVTNEGNFLRFTMVSPGDYYMSITDNGIDPSAILPENFYPDYTVPGEYPPIPGYFFNQIKLPPFCGSDFTYVIGEEFNNVIDIGVKLETDKYSLVQGAPPNNLTNVQKILAFDYKRNDPLNYVTLGNSYVRLNATNLYFNFTINAYITGLPVGTYIFNWTGIISIIAPLNAGTNYKLSLIQVAPNGVDLLPATEVIIAQSNYQTFIRVDPGGTSVKIVNLSPTNKWVLYFYADPTGSTPPALPIDFTITGTLTFKRDTIIPPVPPIIKTIQKLDTDALMFKSKYIFDNYEHSIYSASSKISLPPTYFYNTSIAVNYDDKWLNNFAYLSEIKNIVLAYSDDDGATWYNYETLDPYQFVASPRTYDYTGNNAGLTVPNTEIDIQYHTIPNASFCQEYIGDRLFHGNIIDGYDKIVVNLFTNVYYQQETNTSYPFFSVKGWKYGYKGIIGIVYYDDYDRKSAVCINENSYINIPYENTSSLVPKVSLTITNEPPEWATKFQIVRTKDLFTNDYLIWYPDFVYVCDINLTTTTIGGNTPPAYIAIDVRNITFYVDKVFLGQKIKYTYVSGQRIRIINPLSTVIPIYDVEILLELNGIIYIKYDTNCPFISSTGLNPPNPQYLITKFFFEIYNPLKNYDDNIFYETGECYDISIVNVAGQLKKYHTGNVQNQGPASPSAIINLTDGDVYYRYRLIPNSTSTAGTFDNYVSGYISSSQPNDYVEDNFYGLGRTNITTLPGKQFLFSEIRFSDLYVSEQIMQINVFTGLNAQSYNSEYGALKKLQVVNNDVLKLIWGNSYQLSIYVSQGVIRQTQGAGNLISLSDEVAGNSHIIQRTLGTINGESVVVNDEGDMFGYDENEGIVWVSSGNGLIQVSDRGMKSIFKRYSNERKATGDISTVPCVYDLYHDEYIITLGTMGGQPMIPPTLLVNNIPDLDPATFNTVFFRLESIGNNIVYYNANAFSSSIYNLLNSLLPQFGYTLTRTINPPTSVALTTPNPIANNNYNGWGSINATNWTASSPAAFWLIDQAGGYFYWEYYQTFVNPPGIIFNNNYRGIYTILNAPLNSTINIQVDYETFGGALAEVVFFTGAGANVQEYKILNAISTGFYTTLNITLPFIDFNNAIWGIYCVGTFFQSIRFKNLAVSYIVPTPDSITITAPNYANYINKDLKITLGGTVYSYNFSGGQAGTNISFNGVTIAYNKQKQGWTSYYSFVPEYYGRVRDYIVSFKDGELWAHDRNVLAKNFYGVQYSRELTYVSNKDFPKVKDFKAISINGIGLNDAPTIRILPFQGYLSGMLSSLSKRFFQVLEGVQYAHFQKDKLSPGFGGNQLQALANGRNLKGQVIEVTLVNDDTAKSSIYSSDIVYFYSEHS